MGLSLEQVVERQAETLREAADCRVAGIDQLAEPLGDLLKVPVVAVAEHASADPARSLVHCAADAGVGQFERTAHAGDAGADNRDCRPRGAK
jgi:hypothetical protein